MNVPREEFDLSALTYPQFLAFFFDRPVVGDQNDYELFRSGIDSFVASDPARVVTHLQRICESYAHLAEIYSHEQLDQGLWAVFGAGIYCGRYLFDTLVNTRLRIDCVEATYLPFRDVVARNTGDIRESFYWMWWDMILHAFWHDCDYALTDDGKHMAEKMYQTLARILALDHRGCQWCALHGLGHLRHPLGRDLVQRYLNVHRSELSEADARWVESCRDGSCL
jgi:hypothetical protein